MIEKWLEVRNTFGELFLWFESRRLNKDFVDWLDYSDYIYKNGIAEPWDLKLQDLFVKGKALIINYRESLHKKGPKFKKGKRSYLLPIMPLLLFSLHQNHSVDEKCLLRACKLMGVRSEKENVFTWVDATKKYLSNWHPEGVVKEAITLKSK